MNWPLFAVIAMAGLVFITARLWFRRWIIKRWLDDQITNRQAAVLFVLTFLAPMLIVTGIGIVSDPGSSGILVLVMLLIAGPMLALAGGLMDYAAQHGVKQQMLRDRARRAGTSQGDLKHGS